MQWRFTLNLTNGLMAFARKAGRVADGFLTLEERAYQDLRAEILNGDLPPGSRLASSSLAERFRVSRITISNALKLLSSDGLVVLRPHREAVVATLNEQDLHEIFLIRHALEDIVLEVAASRATPEAIAYLRTLDGGIRASIVENDAASYRRREREFHLQVYALSSLHLVATTLIELWTRLEPYRSRRHAELGLSPDSIADREAIIAALEQRDGQAAALAMRRHVDRGYEHMLRTLQAASGASGHQPGKSRDRTAFVLPAGSLTEALAKLPDTRRSQGQLYPQASVLALIVLAGWCGARSRSEIEAWGGSCHPAIRDAVGLSGLAAPSGPTVHRFLTRVGEASVAECVREWREVIADADLPRIALAGHTFDPSFALAVEELRIAMSKRTGERTT